ncbi:Uu.00g061960.m01.CDS01 [Anthostomella pinea]|uniref:Uu.00g061960.m01.CDS01 n=1 Tax=Anthostomella pinea TaxID=933095 RepID=A0AAI8VSL0_9PEZI|nr:Uu.00g061960.m01.CDS01 [Anthostomella pinea]
MLVGCFYGYGQHESTLTEHQRHEAFKSFYLCQITYKTSINLTKASILLLYLRIFSGVKWFRWTCCSPVTAAFDKTITQKTCMNNAHFWFANATWSVLTDIIVLFLPMPLVYALQIPRDQKVALVIVFTLGAFVVITSCLRITTLDIQATTTDPLYDIASTMWTIIEMNVAVICACLPQIRPLIVKLFPKLMPNSYYHSREKLNKHTTGNSFSKSHVSNQQSAGEGSWLRILPDDGVNLTSIRKGNASSTDPILQGGKGLQIQKTVQYSVEYSNNGSSRKHDSGGDDDARV